MPETNREQDQLWSSLVSFTSGVAVRIGTKFPTTRTESERVVDGEPVKATVFFQMTDRRITVIFTDVLQGKTARQIMFPLWGEVPTDGHVSYASTPRGRAMTLDDLDAARDFLVASPDVPRD